MNDLRQRVAVREEGQARVGSVTAAIVLASVVAAGAVAVALPGAARATGIVTLLPTAVLLLGLVVTRNCRIPGLPQGRLLGLAVGCALIAVAAVAWRLAAAGRPVSRCCRVAAVFAERMSQSGRPARWPVSR